MKRCPICFRLNDDNWPINVDGVIKVGCCQDCWEDHCNREWWKVVTELDKKRLTK
jgi:hypothetical protein